MPHPRAALEPFTLQVFAEKVLRPCAVAQFGEAVVRIFELALEETGDIEFAGDLALAVRNHREQNR